MKIPCQSIVHRSIWTTVLLAVACILCPPLMRSQTIDNCNSGVVDSENGVEQTVCITGDPSSLDASAEVDTNVPGYEDDYDTYAASVGVQGLVYAGSTLEWTSPSTQGNWNEVGTDSEAEVDDYFTPAAGATYYLDSNYAEEVCNTGDWCSSWSQWETNGGLGEQATAPTGVQGYIDPKYIVLGVTYAPPGPQSSVTYTNSQAVATTNSLINTVSSGTTYSVSIANQIGIGAWKVGTSVGYSTGATQTTKDSQSTTINWSVTNTIKTYGTPTAIVSGAYTSPVDNDYDIIYVWLNPVEVLTLGQNFADWNGYGYDATDQNGMDIVGIALGYLNGDFGSMPADLQTSLNRSWATNQIYGSGQSAALSSTDFAAIAQYDPFSNSSYGPNEIGSDPPVPSTPDNRFTITLCNGGNSVDFDQADPSQSPSNYTCSLSYSNMTSSAQDYTNSTTTTFSLDRSYSGSVFQNNLTLDFKYSDTTTTTTEVDSSISNTQSSSAAVNIIGLPCDNVNPYLGPCVPVYNGPTQFMVYQDDLWGTFMLAPIDYF
jgi:hypothetical protein